MFTEFKYLSTKANIRVSVPSHDFVYYRNNNKAFIKAEGTTELWSFESTIIITKKGSFLWKTLPDDIRNDKDFKKFCKKVWKLRGFM